jgi:putative hydrolase of the HAD superfamily
MSRQYPLRAITFDAAGTLIRVAEPVADIYARLAREHGAELSPEALDAGFRKVFADMPPMAFDERDPAVLIRCERDWWRNLVARVIQQAGHVAAFDAYFDALFDYYADGHAWRAYPEAHAALQSARQRGLRIAVVSNFDSRLPPILRTLGLEHQLDAVVYSTGCGAAKPDPRIFEHALQALDTPAEAALHVGDNLQADYHGAVAAGMRALHLQRRAGAAASAIPTIRHLGEIDPRLD